VAATSSKRSATSARYYCGISDSREETVAIVDEVKSANEKYAASFGKGSLPMPPGRAFAVVTCMDARLDPAKFLGLEEGDAHVIRNAGGVVSDDALRSLIISHNLLGTQEAIVIGHTDCGMLTFTNDDIHAKLGPDSESIDFLPFPDAAQRVRESVQTIASSPLLPDSFKATGFVYNVETGRLEAV
jgi:carbonic anhydrase